MKYNNLLRIEFNNCDTKADTKTVTAFVILFNCSKIQALIIFYKHYNMGYRSNCPCYGESDVET